jgi:hypothetical protein
MWNVSLHNLRKFVSQRQEDLFPPGPKDCRPLANDVQGPVITRMIARPEVKNGELEQTASPLVWMKVALIAILVAVLYGEIVPDLA